MRNQIPHFGVFVIPYYASCNQARDRKVIMMMIMTQDDTYQQNMKLIWDNLNQLPKEQARVVLSQLWAYGKTASPATLKSFPALAAHGFLTEEQQDGAHVWKPVMPNLKDFWRIGIQVSNDHGFLLQPRRVFEANLQAYMSLLQNEEK
jgi:hypothetical protein